MIPNKIILHHSLTKDFRTVSWPAIRNYHVNELNWQDIGYHFGIEQVNDSYEIFMGRMPYIKGAHARRQNESSLGICFVGDFDTVAVPEGQWKKGLVLVRWLMNEYNISINNIWPHSAFADKTCPGLKFDIPRFCAQL